jgi:SnoaL-like domain
MTSVSGGGHRYARRLAQALALMGAIFVVSQASAQTAAKTPWELTEHQKGIPGPTKHEMSEADYSGTVNTDPQFIADRLAILNLVTAYAYLIDEGRWDQWYELFSDDVTLEVTSPCIGSVTIKGKATMNALTALRYLEGGPTTAMRRHTMGNIHVAEQTATTAKVRSYMLISTVPASDVLKVLTTGTYNASLEKRNGRWIITRWYIEADAILAGSPMPTGVAPGTVTFVPDDRPACKQ